MRKNLPELDLFAGGLDAALASYQDRKAKGKLKKKISESDIESKWKAKHEDTTGGLSLKFVSPARRSVPDRITLTPIPAEHREIVAKYFRFVEYKAPGQKPTDSQRREHERYRALGFTVDVIDYLPPKD